MKEPLKNTAASIQARLKKEAERQQRPFAEILQYYAMERFLYRLSKTKYAARFVLKGGLLFYVWNISLRRPTKDIDFRGYVVNDQDAILEIFREVIMEPAYEDGLTFDAGSIIVDETQIDADYQGLRAKLNAYLGRSKIIVQIDIGFSDQVASKAEPMDYPIILSDLDQIQLKGYPKESVIAEKFHAMVRYAELNSRMKDYYDVWLLAENFEFECLALQKAIEMTFDQRETVIPVNRPVGLRVEFASANQTRWVNFLQKMDIGNSQSDDFSKVMETIWNFLEMPLGKIGGATNSNNHWIPGKGWK